MLQRLRARSRTELSVFPKGITVVNTEVWVERVAGIRVLLGCSFSGTPFLASSDVLFNLFHFFPQFPGPSPSSLSIAS